MPDYGWCRDCCLTYEITEDGITGTCPKCLDPMTKAMHLETRRNEMKNVHFCYIKETCHFCDRNITEIGQKNVSRYTWFAVCQDCAKPKPERTK